MEEGQGTREGRFTVEFQEYKGLGVSHIAQRSLMAGLMYVHIVQVHCCAFGSCVAPFFSTTFRQDSCDDDPLLVAEEVVAVVCRVGTE